jgi:hypothetical protein
MNMSPKLRLPPAEQLTLDIAGTLDNQAETAPSEQIVTNPILLHIRKMQRGVEVLNGLDEEAKLRNEIHAARSRAGKVGNIDEQQHFKDEAKRLDGELDISIEDTKELFANMIGITVIRDKHGKVKVADPDDHIKLDVRYTSYRTNLAAVNREL